MANTIKTRPSVGDVFMIIDGEKRFVAGSNATTAFLDAHDCVGVVYDAQGNLFRVVSGVNNQGKQFSCVADYEITAIPSESGYCAVTLNGVAQGNFTYTKSTGSIEEFATQLNTWLAAQASGTKALKWEAYTNNGHSYLQMKTYDEYESTVSVAGATLVKLIGSELAAYTVSSTRNAVKQSLIYNGMCRARLEDYCKNNSSGNCNPSGRMNGTTQLFETFPCSETYYNGSLGDGLRSAFATYSDYLDACMARLRELNHGIMQFRDGKAYTDLLYAKTILKAGVSTKAYPAAEYCKDFNCGVTGYGAGTFWLPSMYELGLLMKDITNGTSVTTLDKVNTALSKKTGWSQISSTSNRWSSCRYYSNHAWNYSYYGICDHTGFYYSFPVAAVSAFEI